MTLTWPNLKDIADFFLSFRSLPEKIWQTANVLNSSETVKSLPRWQQRFLALKPAQCGFAQVQQVDVRGMTTSCVTYSFLVFMADHAALFTVHATNCFLRAMCTENYSISDSWLWSKTANGLNFPLWADNICALRKNHALLFFMSFVSVSIHSTARTGAQFFFSYSE